MCNFTNRCHFVFFLLFNNFHNENKGPFISRNNKTITPKNKILFLILKDLLKPSECKVFEAKFIKTFNNRNKYFFAAERLRR